MATAIRKVIYLNIFKNYVSNKFLLPVTKCKTLLPYSILNYSSDLENNESSEIECVKVYMKKYNEEVKFLQDKQKEFDDGVKHLANIMGEKVENMTQEKIDSAIEYLFPSALFFLKARPMLKPPQELFEKQSSLIFNRQGRPFHYLFYTTTPLFNEALHEASTILENLNDGKIFDDQASPLIMENSAWFTLEELQDLFRERLREIEYEKFLEIFETLASHPLSGLCSDFIMKYRKQLSTKVIKDEIKPEVLPDGSIRILIERCTRKSSVAKVLVTCPGTGILNINGQTIDYFRSIQSREQVKIVN